MFQADGSAPFSVARAMLENDAALPAEQSDVETIKNLAGLVYAAAADTTVSALLSFFLAILVYPDVQAKGQEEIDRVVGKDRLPTLEDMERLPYVQAIVKECWRWIPVIPMGGYFPKHQ
jgi:cytochrome P450